MFLASLDKKIVFNVLAVIVGVFAERNQLSDAYDGGRLQEWPTLSVRSSDLVGNSNF
jgi:hypothetical protein